MLGLTGDPVRQTTLALVPCSSSRYQQCRRAAYVSFGVYKGHKAASTSHQAATAFTGGHGATPCASAAAAAAAAPTALQDLLVQAAHEESNQCYPQTHHVGVEDFQLQQLQHHDQVLLQQQLEHLHQKHQRRHQEQHCQLCHQQEQQQHQQQDQQQDQGQQQQSYKLLLSPHPGRSASRTSQQQQYAGIQQLQQHSWQDNSSTPAVQSLLVVQDMPAQRASHAVSNASGRKQHVGIADRHTQDRHYSTQGYSSGSSDCDSSSISVSTLAAHADTLAAQAQVFAAAAPLSQQTQSHAAHQEAQGVQNCNNSGMFTLQQPGSSHTLQQQQQQQQHRRHHLGRTPEGLPLVRLRRGSSAPQVAADMVRVLQQEQQVVLSAAGADLALLALNCLERAVCLQQQQQQQPGSLLLAVPQVRSSKRPDGSGRCQVYDLVCSLQAPEQQQQQQQHDDVESGVLVCAPLPQQQQQQQEGQQHFLPSQQQQQGRVRLRGGQDLKPGFSRSMVHEPAPASFQQQQQQKLSVSMGAAQHSQQSVLAGELLHTRAGDNHWHMQLGHSSTHQVESLYHQQQQWRHQQQQQQLMGVLEPECGSHCQPQQQQQGVRHYVGAGEAHDSSMQPVEGHKHSQGHSTSVQQQEHQHQPQAQSNMNMELAHRISSSSGAGAAGDHAAASGAGAGATAVQQLKVVGCSINFADSLEDALSSSGADFGAVLLPVAHPKQAVRVLEGVWLLSRRWQQRQQQRQWPQLPARDGSATTSTSSSSSGQVGGSGCGAAVGLQLGMQARRGKVRGKGGSVRGLHVFVYAAPHVQ